MAQKNRRSTGFGKVRGARTAARVRVSSLRRRHRLWRMFWRARAKIRSQRRWRSKASRMKLQPRFRFSNRASSKGWLTSSTRTGRSKQSCPKANCGSARSRRCAIILTARRSRRLRSSGSQKEVTSPPSTGWPRSGPKAFRFDSCFAKLSPPGDRHTYTRYFFMTLVDGSRGRIHCFRA